MVHRVIEKHAGERRKADMLEIAARKDRHLDVHLRRGPRLDGEAIGTCRGGTFEECPYDDRNGIGCRRADPERAEEGKFLAIGLARVDRQTARRESVEMALAYGAKIRGSLKHAELIII